MKFVFVILFMLSPPLLGEPKTKPLEDVLGFQHYKGNDLLYFPKYHKAYNLPEQLLKNGLMLTGEQLDCEITRGLKGFGFQNAIVFEKPGFDYFTILSRETMVSLQCDLTVLE